MKDTLNAHRFLAVVVAVCGLTSCDDTIETPKGILKSFTINPGAVAGGNEVEGTVVVELEDEKADCQLWACPVSLASSDPAVVTVPDEVYLGGIGTADMTFKIQTKPVLKVARIGLSAVYAGEEERRQISVPLGVLPPSLSQAYWDINEHDSLSISNPPPLGEQFLAWVSLDGPATSDAVVEFETETPVLSDFGALLGTPQSVTIGQTETRTSFDITVAPCNASGDPASAYCDAYVYASYNGKTVSLYIQISN